MSRGPVLMLAILAGARLAAAREPLPSLRPVVRGAAPAVVTVLGPAQAEEDENESETLAEAFRRLLGETQPGAAVGSGFVITADGEIVSSAQAAAVAEGLRVRLASGEELGARVVGSDERTGVALLRVDPRAPLPTLPLGDGDEVEPGDWVVALGNPTGRALTAAAGIVAAKARVLGIGPGADALQIDATVPPGAAGGPLLDEEGRVVGMTAPDGAQPGGASVALPVEALRPVLDLLRRFGRVPRGWIGVAVQPVTPALAPSFGLPATEGALVADVAPDSPAAGAGLERGDVIVRFGDRVIRTSRDLPGLIAETPPGTRVPLVVLRDGQERGVEVVVAELPPPPPPAPPTPVAEEWGLLVEPLTRADAKRYGVEPGTGVLVVDVAPGGPAEDTGIEAGDVVVEVARRRVASPESFWAALQGRDHALLLVRRGRTFLYLDLRR